MKTPYIVIHLLVGLIFLVLTFCLNVFPPKKINGTYGYRTAKAKKNQETWDFANNYSAKLFLYAAIVLVILEVLLMVCFGVKTTIWFPFVYLTIAPFIIMYLTEKQLSIQFP